MEKVILHFLIFYSNILCAKSETTEAEISFRYEPTSNNLLQAIVPTSIYSSFQEVFINTRTTSVFLKYKRDDSGLQKHVFNIKPHSNVNEVDHFYFNCSNNKSSETIECYRDVSCNGNSGRTTRQSKLCANGFGINWAYESEYLSSKHLQNSSVNCSKKNKITCYTLVKNDDSTTAESSTTEAGSPKEFDSVSSSTSTIKTVKVLYAPLIVILTYSTLSKPLFITSTTTASLDHNPKSSSSDSTSVIAGVTVSIVIVIIIVIIIVVVYKKRQQQKESIINSESPTVSLESNPISFNDNLYNNRRDRRDFKQTNSQNTVRILPNNERFDAKSNLNSFTNISLKDNTVYRLQLSLPETEYEVIEGSQTLTQPDTTFSDHEDNDAHYTTIDDNQGRFVPTPEIRLIEEDYCCIDTNFSVISKVPEVTLLEEYSTINENVGYNNDNEIEYNIDPADEHEYNNIKHGGITIGQNEGSKNVTSNRRKNIRHYDQGNVDERATMPSEDNSPTLAYDNMYFILET